MKHKVLNTESTGNVFINKYTDLRKLFVKPYETMHEVFKAILQILQGSKGEDEITVVTDPS